MRLFSRNPEAVDGAPAADVPFETLRRPARASSRSRGSIDGQRDTAPPLDPADAAKTRARRRLIGAVALAAAAVVFVPMLFDRTPVATVDDISLQIPDRDTPFEGRRGVPETARVPLKPSQDLPVVSGAAPPPVVQPTPEPAVPPPSAADRPADVVAKPEPTPPKPTPSAPVDKPSPAAADDPKALAALEGKAGAAPESARSFAVQVAAFSVADSARSLRDRLVANGLKSYTEPTSTSQGPRTRVRLGPYASREAADRAREKLKTMKLDGSVVPL